MVITFSYYGTSGPLVDIVPASCTFSFYGTSGPLIEPAPPAGGYTVPLAHILEAAA